MTMPAAPASPVREAVAVWVAVILGLAAIEALALAVPFLHGWVSALAVAAFLYAPVRYLEKRGQDARDAGWRFDRLGQDLAWSLGTCALVLPLFALGFFVFASWLDQLPGPMKAMLAPYARVGAEGGLKFGLHLPLSLEFAGQVAGNAAVAFAEEFFYRGYLTLRFQERWRPLRSAVVVAALFAVGHLLEPAPWRLAVFFPALWFAWLRWRTGTILGASIAHFLSNVWLLILQNSLYFN
jgi:membrane protease YdiL (CAAX protease family)